MSDAVSSVILLIGLAVGVDYSMFYLRREREERAKGRSPREAYLVKCDKDRLLRRELQNALAKDAGALLCRQRRQIIVRHDPGVSLTPSRHRDPTDCLGVLDASGADKVVVHHA